jgi:hypothetical protein
MASRSVVFHLGGGEMSAKTQWPQSPPTTPTPTTATPPEKVTMSCKRTAAITHPQPSPDAPSPDAIWYSLTIALQKMGAAKPEKRFGF